MVFNSPCLTDKKELIHHEVEMVINSPWIMPLLGTKGLASPEQTATEFDWLIKSTHVAAVVPKSVAGSRFPEGSSMYSSQDSSRLDVAAKFIFQSSRYVVPTGRVVVPTGRYVVPAGKVIIIVSPGRLSLVPTGRVAAALTNLPLWVMNVVPLNASDTSPVIIDKGLIGQSMGLMRYAHISGHWTELMGIPKDATK
ncbi:ribonuclease H-like domain-containing protein [Tanacetum coccineum]|uniref:Ribonuclease H-like domain-containing protein n=1 Tax=Tanacetum coccineum TaxID=301880 RepID=A0ABQ5HKW3_9ASTR